MADPIRPQAGPQSQFLASAADIAIYGGAAGGGKTWALLMEQLRHIGNSNFGAVFFRRTPIQVRNEGGLWDESGKLYPLVGGMPRAHALDWRFPSGASVSFAYLEYDKNVYDWQGSQIPLLCFRAASLWAGGMREPAADGIAAGLIFQFPPSRRSRSTVACAMRLARYPGSADMSAKLSVSFAGTSRPARRQIKPLSPRPRRRHPRGVAAGCGDWDRLAATWDLHRYKAMQRPGKRSRRR